MFHHPQLIRITKFALIMEKNVYEFNNHEISYTFVLACLNTTHNSLKTTKTHTFINESNNLTQVLKSPAHF